MIKGLYTGATGMVGKDDYQGVIARNLANINTVGYKKNIAFQSFLAGAGNKGGDGASQAKKSGSVAVSTDFSQGALEYTGNNLDIALKGEGFFAVRTPAGNVYTRKGQFMLSSDLRIVSPEGWSLSDIQIPKNAKNITIKGNGSISVDGKELGKISVVTIPDTKKLESIGGCAYILPKGAEAEEATEFEVAQGYVEKSNVNAIDEMVNMIANMRGFEVGNKSTDAVDESVKKLIQTAS